MIDPWFLMLAAKMATAAAIVVGCSLVAERSGPLLAALIATLPISAGPVLVFLALEHGAGFLAEAALASMGANLATAAMIPTYVLLAQRHGTAVSLAVSLAAWGALAVALRHVPVTALSVLLSTVVAYGALHILLRRYRSARPEAPPARIWYAIPLRAAAVAALAGTVTTLSKLVGSGWSGTLAALPVVFSSLIAMLQPTIGGPAVAAIVASSALGLMGFGLAIATVHLAAPGWGSSASLLLGLLVSLVWNLVLLALNWRSERAGARR